MKKHLISMIVMLCILCNLAAAPIASAEMDYEKTYETALQLAKNDLTNLDNLNDAIVMLEPVGSFGFARSYLLYFQALVDVQQNESMETAILRLDNCRMLTSFVEDLQVRGLPSCDELLVYINARKLEDSGRIDDAYSTFVNLPVLDAPDRAFQLRIMIANAAAAAREAKYSIGNYVTFGHYPQTSEGNDNTPIEWLVLDRDGSKALLLSRYGLDAQPYNKEFTDTTWEKCTLRAWLNSTFIDKAFTAQEQAGILRTNVDNSDDQGSWGPSGGNNTQDRVFLLSCAEVSKYFGVTMTDHNNTQSRVAPTAYAIEQGVIITDELQTMDGDNTTQWALRSPGTTQDQSAIVYYDGSLLVCYVNIAYGCVRPALWINLESDIF